MSILAFVLLLAVALSLGWLAIGRSGAWRRVGSRRGSSSDLLFYAGDSGASLGGGSDASCGADGGGACDGGGGD